MDSVAYLKSAAGRQSFDIIFIDPPYASGLVPACLAHIADGDLLAAGGTICVETAEENEGKKKKKLTDEEEAAKILDAVFGGDAELMEKFTVRRTAVYSRSRLTLLER